MDDPARRRRRPFVARWLPRLIIVSFFGASGQSALVSDRSAPTPETETVGRVEQEDARTLQPGASADGTIGGGECRRYRVLLDSGQVARLTVDQGVRDLAVRARSADGVVQEVDNRWHGPEQLIIHAATAGWHLVEVCSMLASSRAEPYAIAVDSIGPLAPEDAPGIDAHRQATEAKRLFAQGTGAALQRAIAAYEKLLPQWRSLNDAYGEAQTLNTLGVLYNLLGNPARALEMFEVALPRWQQLGYKPGEAETLGNIGAAYSFRGSKRLALSYHERALALHRAAGNRYGELFARNGIGAAYMDLGEPHEALGQFETVLALVESAGDRSIRQRTLNNLGTVYEILGETQKALDAYDRALASCVESKDPRCEANVGTNRGTLSRRLGDFDAAAQQYRKAIDAATLGGDVRAQAFALHFMGLTHHERGQLESAQPFYEQALAIFQQILDRRAEGALRVQMGKLYFDRHAHDQALEAYRAGIQLLREAGDVRNEAQGHHGIALVHAARGDREMARQNLEQVLKLAAPLNDHQTQADMLLSLAGLERDLGRLDEASQRLDQALLLIESLRGKVSQQRLRTSLLASKQRFYETAIDVLMRLDEQRPAKGYAARAFEVSERSRARSLLDLLAELGADLRGTAEPELLERERALHERLSAKGQRQLSLGGNKQALSEAAEIGKEIDQIAEELEAVGAEIRRNSPRYATLTQFEPLSAGEVQRQLLDDDTAVFELALGEQQSYAWLVTRRAIVSARLPPRGEIERVARRVYDLLTARIPRSANESAAEWARRMKAAEADYPAAVRALSQALLRPFAGQLTTRLVVVPDGALQYVPFAALSDPNTPGEQPLVVNHEIVTLPSIATVRALRQELSNRPAPRGSVAVIADPVVDAGDSRLSSQDNRRTPSSSPQSGPSRGPALRTPSELEQSLGDITPDDVQPGFARLQGTGREADIIASLAAKDLRLVARGFDATRELVMSPLLGRYASVHFATHGIINPVRPELSGLVLSLIDQNGNSTPGFLRAHEIYNLRLPVDLVVLSACRTGLGKDVRGEGLIGLSRGFMYAGARRVVVSLWKIDDDATAELMGHFYRAMLRDHLAPAAALQRAQVAMWKSRRWRSPFYWAAFVIQGEWRR